MKSERNFRVARTLNNHDKVHLNRFSSLTGSENDSSEQMSKLKETVSLSSDKPMSQPVSSQANGRSGSVTQMFRGFFLQPG